MNVNKLNYISLLNTSVCTTLGIVFSIVLLTTVIQYYSFNESYFQHQFKKNNISTITGIATEDLTKVIRQITGYLAGKEASFNLTLPIAGKESPVFNDRELAHMLDVKVIYILLDKIKNFGLFLLILFFIPYSLFVYLQCRHHRNAKNMILRRHYWMNLYKILISNAVFALIFIAALGFMLLTNFSKYFILFHQIFFDNDLWLLNPKTDRLIQMLPESFFYDISFQILQTYTLISLILGIISLFFYYILKKDDTSI